MQEASFDQFLNKKAYEISYACFRAAAVLKQTSLSEEMRLGAIKLLGSTVRGKYDGSRKAVKELEYFLRLAGDVGILRQETILVIIGELERLFPLLGDSSETTEEAPGVNLEGIFSQASLEQNTKKQEENGRLDQGFIEIKREASTTVNEERGSARLAIRQSAILEIIRQQRGNLLTGQAGCRLKDIQDAFPGTSERTLRYDVQGLIDQGAVERVGNGGPHTYYRVKEESYPQVTFDHKTPL